MACVKWLKPIKTTRTTTAAKEEEEEEEAEPLSPASRLFHAPQMNCCIVAMVGCKTVINVEVIKDGIYQTIVKHPRFSSKLVFDSKNLESTRPIGWIRTTVDLNNHIITPNLDSYIDSPNEFVEDYVSNLAETSMDLTKPLWELHILNIKTKDANHHSIAVFRIHHSIGDGISLMSLVLACTRKTDDPNVVPTLPTTNMESLEDTSSSSSSFCLWGFFMWLLLAFKMLWYTIIDLFMFSATMFLLKDTKTHLKGSSETGKAPKKFVYRNLSLDDIKFVKNNMNNVTINDVVLGITEASLSCYLNRKYSESKGMEKAQQNNLPKHIRLRSTLLVNIRPTSTLEDLVEQMETEDPKRKWKWGNSIGYILVPFHIVLREDPLDYIRGAKAIIDKKKHSLEAFATYLSAKYVLKFLGLKVAVAITHKVLYNTTLSFSNVVGPKDEIGFYGHPITFLAPSVYGHPQALTIHFQSYMDKMTLVVAVDQNVIPEPHNYFAMMLRNHLE